MISIDGDYLHIATARTSYVMRILDTGYLDHVCYGERILDMTGIGNASESFDMNICTVPCVDEEHPHYFPARFLSEYPASGSGDSRECALEIEYGQGIAALSLLFESCRVMNGKDSSFPASALPSGDTETLAVVLKDAVLPIYVTLFYTVYEQEDVILRSALIENRMEGPVKIKAAASLAVDFPYDDFTLVSFDGAWGRERHEEKRRLLPGIAVIDSKLGTSSNEHSPLVFLERGNGEAYGFNLIYSGNHRECVEVSPFGKTRIVTGINPYGFEWILAPGETFATPEAIVSYSKDGIDEVSLSFHRFVERYIVRGSWKGKERPVLINSWEASYFNFTEESLLRLASKSAELGFELFVLDDGWFGRRRSDRAGLGDWYVNTELFPSGLEGFAGKLRAMGLGFGLWVEPEMINEDSDLYREHPEWVAAFPDRKPLLGRHQLILDMTREDVRNYLYSRLEDIFSSCSVDYVKWDMNRTITDCYTRNPECRSMGEFMHRYMLGLYELLSRIVSRFPDILFESCASGGNRYDIGMLCFMPQTWTSDNTDLRDRLLIQQGTLRGFPPSTMSAHVSASPGHQSLRTSLIESRFDVAAFGVLGYELDLNELTELDGKAVKAEIAFYKQYRKVFQFGSFRVLHLSESELWWTVTYGPVTIAMEYILNNIPNSGRCSRLIIPFLDRNRKYRIRNRHILIPKEFFGSLYKDYKREEGEDFEAIVSGSVLSTCGIALLPSFNGSGLSGNTRAMNDNSSRMYIIEEV